jgi:hypothetical protein
MRSPGEGLTPAEVISFALMKTARDDVCIMVEGSKDRDAFAAVLRIPPSHCVPARGKRAVLEVGGMLAATGKRRVVAIVDADGSAASGDRPESVGCDVFVTDTRDLESMLFFSTAGRRVLAQLFDADIVAAAEKGRGMPLQQWIAGQLAVVGAVRVLNEEQDLYIGFANHPLAQYTDAHALAFRSRDYIRDVGTRNRRITDPAAFGRQVGRILDTTPPQQLVHGHDLSAFLSLLAAGPLGAGGAPRPDAIELALRAAYTPWDFRSTKLYADLVEWGSRNVAIVIDD